MKKILTLMLCAILLMPKVFAGGSPEKYIAITFDDGPSGDLTQALLDGLAERNVKATFFVCGYRVEQFPDCLRRIADEGHEIGLHSCCHAYMHKMTKEEIAADLTDCARAVKSCCGVSPVLFRPPGGLYSESLLETAGEYGTAVILWSVDPRDWDEKNSANVYRTVVEDAAPGAIILMHELSENSVRSALRAIDTLTAQGYCFCTVSELARAYERDLAPGEVYRFFRRDDD
ncbi:MAG: polysaccharide deacetylase family protein [Clostridia bacterium]|nr:polysaccharide deacetylase family protein [Clostridia bacterium]